MAEINYDWEQFGDQNEDEGEESGDGLDEFRGEFFCAHRDRRVAVEDRFEPPQMAGLNSELTAVRQTPEAIVRTYANGDTHTTFTAGQYRGAEMLQNRDGQIVSQLTTPGSEGPGLARLRMDYTYNGPGQGLAGSVRVTNVRTGEVEREISTPNGEGSIFASPMGLDVNWPANGQMGPQSQHIRMDGVRMNESAGPGGAERSMDFIAQQEMTTPCGVTFPRGARVQHHHAKGNDWTTVTRPDGQVDRYRRVGQGLALTGSEFPQPRNLAYAVNGANMNFPGVRQLSVDANNGDLLLGMGNGLTARLVNQNGAYARVEYTKKDK